MEEQEQVVIINNIQPPQIQQSHRTITMVGDLDEKLSSEIMSGLIYLRDNGTSEVLVAPDDPESIETKEVKLPIELVISTFGGSTPEMFGVYDLVRSLREDHTVTTFGLGKVMSAGVLLLASGTRGERKVGRSCRLMIHAISASVAGTVQDMETEIKEIKWIQDTYAAALAKETKLTVKKIQKMFSTGEDIYLSAEEAVKFGIADKIV